MHAMPATRTAAHWIQAACFLCFGARYDRILLDPRTRRLMSSHSICEAHAAAAVDHEKERGEEAGPEGDLPPADRVLHHDDLAAWRKELSPL